MPRYCAVAVLFLLSCAEPNEAQEPRWALFAPGLHGAIAVDPANSDVVYVSVGRGGSPEGGMWKTTDGGQTWRQFQEGFQIARTKEILIDPENPEVILVGGESLAAGIIKSVDGGQTWFRADSGLVADHHGFMVWSLALDNQRRIFYAADTGTLGGVFRSSDGVHWGRTTASLAFTPLDLVVDETTGLLYAGTSNGVWTSSDFGSSWIQISNGLDIDPRTVWHLAKVPHSNTLYAATHRGIYKTVDGGDNWFSVNDSVMARLSFRGGLVVAEADTNTIFAGAEATLDLDPAVPGGVYGSRDGGASWALHRLGLPDSVTNFWVTNLFLDSSANLLYASMSLIFPGNRWETGLYRLRDAATTAVDERHPQPSSGPLALRSYPNPFNSQRTFVYVVDEKAHVVLRLFDTPGKEVVTLLDEPRGPGEYRIPWDGRNAEGRTVPSGIYLATLRVGRRITTAKVLLLK